MASPVTALPAARPLEAARHFRAALAFETDCWDVHEALRTGQQDFVLLQTNGSAETFASGHLPEAIHLHHSEVSTATLSAWADDTLFVVYCAGPHCNAADRAASAIAGHGRHVKKMIGGITGWLDEGFDLVTDAQGPMES